MIGSISPHSVQRLGGLEGVIAPFAANPSAAATVTATAAVTGRPEHRGSMAALAPAAMSALIEAQESLGGDAGPAARAASAQKIDQLLTQLDGAAPSAPPPAQPSFPVQMLLAARQQLSHTYA